MWQVGSQYHYHHHHSASAITMVTLPSYTRVVQWPSLPCRRGWPILKASTLLQSIWSIIYPLTCKIYISAMERGTNPQNRWWKVDTFLSNWYSHIMLATYPMWHSLPKHRQWLASEQAGWLESLWPFTMWSARRIPTIYITLPVMFIHSDNCPD